MKEALTEEHAEGTYLGMYYEVSRVPGKKEYMYEVLDKYREVMASSYGTRLPKTMTQALTEIEERISHLRKRHR